MLTVLNICDANDSKPFRKLVGRIRGNSLKTEDRRIGQCDVRFIEYINRTGVVNWTKIDKITGPQRNRLVCDRGLSLPADMGYRRFEGYEYRGILCVNLALSLLSSVSKKVTVGLADIDASYTSVVRHLLRYTDSVVVVTYESDTYSHVAQELLSDTGAPIRLSKHMGSFYDCDLVIAPKGLKTGLQTKSGSVLLTIVKPQTEYNSTVVYDYSLKEDEALLEQCPPYLDKAYFASALYSQGRMFELGSLVPHLCVSNRGVHTLQSLCSVVEKECDKT